MRVKLDFDDEDCAFEVINNLIHVYLKQEKASLEKIGAYHDVLEEGECEKLIEAMDIIIDWYGVPNED